MKKVLVFTSLIGVIQIANAAQLEQPWLLTPSSSTVLLNTDPILFSWANTAAAYVKNYRIVISMTANFSGYNAKTKTCNVTCFTTTVAMGGYANGVGTTNYSLPPSTSISILKPDSNYYWRVEATIGNSSSLSDVREFALGSPTTPIDPKYVAVATPNVTAVSTDKSTVVQGTPIVFSATIDAALPTGDTVKVDYGNGLTAMTTSATGYSYTATPSRTGLYSVGIYDSKNILKSNKMTGNFMVSALPVVNVPPVLTFVKGGSTTIAGTVYTVQFLATDTNSDLRLINIAWGDGNSDSQNAIDGTIVTFYHTYYTVGSSTFTATAYDFSDATSNVITNAVTISAVIPITTPPSPTSTTPPRFTRIGTTGKTAVTLDDWKCTLDTKSSLLWEVKTQDSSLHDERWSYSWYDPDMTKNGGYAGVQYDGKCGGTSLCNTYDYINSVNTEGLCGMTNWRLPTKSELEGLVMCSDNKTTTLGANEQGNICTGSPSTPTIDSTVFPNTKSDWFWTSSIPNIPLTVVSKTTALTTTTPAVSTTTTPTTTKTTTTSKTTTTGSKTTATTKKATVPAPTSPKVDALSAWDVSFYNGSSHSNHKGNAVGVRLVSGGK